VPRPALACLALLAAVLAASAAQARTGREGTSRPQATSIPATEPGLRALYPQEQTTVWSGSERAEARRSTALALLEREQRLDPKSGTDVFGLKQGFVTQDPAAAGRADRLLSRAWLGYLARRRGTLEPVDARLVGRAMSVLEQATGGGELALAALELAIIEAMGGWRPVGARLESWTEPAALEAPDPEGGEYGGGEPVQRRKLVADGPQLTLRLVQSYDLSAKYLGVAAPESALKQAVRRFQERHALAADGVVGSRTLAALNEPIGQQLARLRLNIARSEDRQSRSELRRYVEVNIPAFELKLVENGSVVLRSRVIVGDDKTPTPVFDDVIRHVELDPSWYVPPSIVKEVVERAAREPGYLERAGFVWRTTESGRTQLVQRPGPENALGRFKFVFPNHHAVYLHDTAQRGLFGRADQALSHGCVRVERPAELALALLAEQGWDAARLEQAFATRRTRRIELVDPVPVFLDYRTADLDAEGRLRLLPDLYAHDRAERTVFSGKRSIRPKRDDDPTNSATPERLAATSPSVAFD
jgi:hypothetical protein